jgi:hypothetical protein
MGNQILIDPLSCVPLQLECFLRGNLIGTGTGFVIIYGGTNYLITCWHVVTGRHSATGKPMATTGVADLDAVGIWYHDAKRLGSWRQITEPLIDVTKGNRLWKEHPLSRQVDVIALALKPCDDVKVHNLDTSLARTDLVVYPSEPVSIVGYPFGIAAAGKFPIWKTGHIAYDIDLDYDKKPVFLVDATTRPGMSGSPVFARRIGGYRSSKGVFHLGKNALRFLGVYSGRIREQADVGMVWKPSVIDDILSR